MGKALPCTLAHLRDQHGQMTLRTSSQKRRLGSQCPQIQYKTHMSSVSTCVLVATGGQSHKDPHQGLLDHIGPMTPGSHFPTRVGKKCPGGGGEHKKDLQQPRARSQRTLKPKSYIRDRLGKPKPRVLTPHPTTSLLTIPSARDQGTKPLALPGLRTRTLVL